MQATAHLYIVTDNQILNPAVYLSAARARHVGAPALAAGETRTGPPDSLGSLLLYFTLAARLDPLTALNAASAVGADRFVRYQRSGTPCLRAAVASGSTGGTGSIVDALRRWAAAGPPGSASVDGNGPVVTLQACDPGAGALPADRRMTDAETQLGNRAALMSQAIDGGLAVPVAQCAADRLFADPALAPVLATSNPTQAQIDQLSGAAQRAAMACTS